MKSIRSLAACLLIQDQDSGVRKVLPVTVKVVYESHRCGYAEMCSHFSLNPR